MAQGRLTITPRELQATAGDDWCHKVTLWEDGLVKDVSAATSITCAVMDLGADVAVSGTAAVSTATGAVWASGVVVLPFSASQTASLFTNEYLVEVRVVIAGLTTTWPFLPVMTQRGVL